MAPSWLEDPKRPDYDLIKSWRSIVTLVVFVLASKLKNPPIVPIQHCSLTRAPQISSFFFHSTFQSTFRDSSTTYSWTS
jgi:hypothetical protein